MLSARTSLGVDLSADGRCITCACLVASDTGLEIRAELASVARRELPKHVSDLITSLAADAPLSPSRITALAAEIAELQADAAQDAWSRARKDLPGDAFEPIVLGARGPMIWPSADDEFTSVIEVSDAALLAERTEFSVIDAFPARDVARGGDGEPLDSLAEWILLHDVKRSRVLLDLGATTRLSFLPCGCEPSVTSGVLATDIRAGQDFLATLARHTIGPDCTAKQRMDLATRGRCDEPLLAHLLSASTAPRRSQTCEIGRAKTRAREAFADVAMRFAGQNSISASDVLCTATHFIAAAVCESLKQCVPPSPTRIQLKCVGAGALDGLLLREIAHRVPPFDAFEFPRGFEMDDALRAACVAILALLHVDHTPQTLTRTTRIEAPRVLGRLTPGSPRNWRRLLTAMANSAPQRMSLRCAI